MKQLTARKLAYSGAALALATVCSMIQFANLPMGGSVTLFSMLFVTLIGYWYGPVVGLVTGVAYGLLQFAIGPYVVTPVQVLLDYPIAFGALGLSGFFHNRKWGLYAGYTVGVIGRYAASFLSGVIFYSEYAQDFFAEYAPGFMGANISNGALAALYSLIYNGSYILPEMVMTLILISIPQVAKALKYVKRQATLD